jgi:hypothetical protein
MAYSATGFEMAQRRFRLRFTFWLDLLKPDEAAIAGQIEQLKADRTFATTVRDGIRLICDLRAGRTDVLCELFPFVAERLKTPEPTVESRLQAHVDRLEALLVSQGNVPINLGQREVAVKSKATTPLVSISKESAKMSADTIAKNFLATNSSFWD